MLVLCIFFPPIAAAVGGGFFSFLINLILTCMGWIPGVVHAYMVIKNRRIKEKNEKLITSIKQESVNEVQQKSKLNSFLGGVICAVVIYSIFHVSIEKKNLEQKHKIKSNEQIKNSQQQKKPSFDKIGSGFFISNLGHIITNQHLIDNCPKITIGDNVDKLVPAELIEVDSVNDLALLRIKNLKFISNKTQTFIKRLSIKIVPLASDGLMRKNDVKGGEDIIVAGFPYGTMFSKTIKVTKGIVSSTRGIGDDSGQFQIDAAVQPGNSGGPIYDRYGNIVGIVVAQLNKLKMAETIGSVPENVNFGIKTSTINRFLNKSGIVSNWAKQNKPVSNEILFDIAAKQTVMVVCDSQ